MLLLVFIKKAAKSQKTEFFYKKVLTKQKCYDKIYKSRDRARNGGIAQLARAIGSYPIGHGFKSSSRYHQGPLVKRLRHGPFTAVTWVRFPYGSPTKKQECKCSVLLRTVFKN